VEKYGRDRHTMDDLMVRHMHFACWITKTTDTFSEYVILITCPQLQWLHNAPQHYIAHRVEESNKILFECWWTDVNLN